MNMYSFWDGDIIFVVEDDFVDLMSSDYLIIDPQKNNDKDLMQMVYDIMEHIGE